VDAARSDGGKHRPHDQKHRSPVVDHGDDELVEIAAKRAMNATDPLYRLFPRRNTLLVCLQATLQRRFRNRSRSRKEAFRLQLANSLST